MAVDPATLMAIMKFAGPIIQGLLGDKGGPGSSFNQGQLGFMEKGLNALNPQMGDVSQNQNFQQGSDWLSSLFSDPDFFKSFEAPIQRQFQEETIPGLANRFAGMGTGGALGSTAFRNQLGREGSRLHEMIASLRGGLQQQGVNQSLAYAQQPVSNYLNQLQTFLTPTQNTYQQSSF
jgi:hypothetical protein